MTDQKWHCSICNRIFEVPINNESCPFCKSITIHIVTDSSCQAMFDNEFKSDATGQY